MSTPTFTWIPSYNSQVTPKFATKQANAGGFSTDRAPDGINTKALEFSVSFSNVRIELVRDINTFLASLHGVYSFYWTAPPPYDAAPRLWKCREWTISMGGPVKSSLKATFLETFNPPIS